MAASPNNLSHRRVSLEEEHGASDDTTREAQHSTPPTMEDNSSTTALYDPERVFSPEHLQALDSLVHPVWIFDIDHRKMAWANAAALELWNAPTLDELLQRSFEDMSEATLESTQGLSKQVSTRTAHLGSMDVVSKGPSQAAASAL